MLFTSPCQRKDWVKILSLLILQLGGVPKDGQIVMKTHYHPQVLAATTGALHWWHIDSDGFGTYIDVKTGLKWWIVAKPKKTISFQGSSHYDFSEFASTDLFTQSEYEVEAPSTSIWDLEAVLLSPGTRL